MFANVKALLRSLFLTLMHISDHTPEKNISNEYNLTFLRLYIDEMPLLFAK